ncbi:MAG: coproporphyrinogen dehydrogenase HemZ, partial [Oscillospiraceae bacterium]|nr:coproporphyrinogen dehydrogenase HemZ [Oscillospiraceae bacterium]
MTLLIVGHPFHFEMENLCRVFFPADEIRRVTPAESARDRLVWRIRTNRLRMNRQRASPWALTRHRAEKDGWVLEAACGRQGRCWRAKRNLPPGTDRNARELALARLLFAVFRRATSYCPPWGLLTGVRPSKLMLQLRADGGGAAAARYFRESLWVSEEKTALAARVAAAEEPVLALTRPETCSLYVAIPFCPSRCSYCSFVSHTVERSSAARLVPEYLEKLREELLRTAEIVRILGLRVASVYVGGGTPTILTAVQLANLCETLRTAFNWGDCGEFTVEAGRPDTITAEKLTVLKEAGVTRVSVNPQSLDDEVLRLAGRRHTAADALAALRLVREAGFREINMDLIAGLPGDSPAGFRRSLEGVRACAPENITVHTLAR